MPRVGTGRQALWPVAVGDRTKKDSKAKTGGPGWPRCSRYTHADSMLASGPLTLDRRITRIHWVERCSPGTIRGVRPLQLKSLTNPTAGLSTGGGLRKPHASNSAGAASNGARVVVSTGESPRQRPRFGKGDCNSRPTTPFPALAMARIGRRGHAAHGGCRLERLKPCLALKSIPCSDARAGAAREGCTRVWTNTPEAFRKDTGHQRETGRWWPRGLHRSDAAHEGSANSLMVKHPGLRARDELVRQTGHEGRIAAAAATSKAVMKVDASKGAVTESWAPESLSTPQRDGG